MIGGVCLLDTAIIVAIISAVQAVGVAIITALIARNKRENEVYRAKREEQERMAKEQAKDLRVQRENRDMAMMTLLFVDAEGTEVLLKKAHGDQVNGDVQKALDAIGDAKTELNRVVNQAAIKL